ncbi:hypothetical protein LCGC14_1664390 [marine sediment metagenome]|uniref:Uncharacterized protein n=1 Tax=marine sediment metagenome TaxID=412755 RepID=A0A0F9IFS7_9ZZZZ
MRTEFEVVGKPVSQGSKQSFPQMKDGKPMKRANGSLVIRTKEDCEGLEAWRSDVAVTARRAFEAAGGDALLHEAVRLTMCFHRPRPTAHFGTGRNAGKLKASAPKYPKQRPDTLKLARAVEDALTGVIWRDDSQVCRHVLDKDWGEYHHVVVVIETLDC